MQFLVFTQFFPLNYLIDLTTIHLAVAAPSPPETPDVKTKSTSLRFNQLSDQNCCCRETAQRRKHVDKLNEKRTEKKNVISQSAASHKRKFIQSCNIVFIQYFLFGSKGKPTQKRNPLLTSFSLAFGSDGCLRRLVKSLRLSRVCVVFVVVCWQLGLLPAVCRFVLRRPVSCGCNQCLWLCAGWYPANNNHKGAQSRRELYSDHKVTPIDGPKFRIIFKAQISLEQSERAHSWEEFDSLNSANNKTTTIQTQYTLNTHRSTSARTHFHKLTHTNAIVFAHSESHARFDWPNCIH